MYVFNIGDGKDTVQDDGSDGSRNTIVFKFAASEIRSVLREGEDLVVSYGASDSVRIRGFYGSNAFGLGYQGDGAAMIDQGEAQARVAQVVFEDGTAWDAADLLAMAPAPETGEIPADPFASMKPLYFINALLGRDDIRAAGKHALTYTFANSFSPGVTGGMLFTAEQKHAVRAAFAKYSAVLDLQFTELVDGSAADLSFALDDLSSVDLGAFAGYAEPATGAIHLNSEHYAKTVVDEFGIARTRSSLNVGEPGFVTLLHEIGHALGLKHPFEAPLLPSMENTSANTVMSYTHVGENPTDLAAFDVAALQFLYGVNDARNSGNDVYSLANRFIADGAGLDSLDASAETQDLIINLAPGSWNYRGVKGTSILAEGQSFIGFDSVIENVTGGSGSDQLGGNAANNVLQGGAGADSLTGGVAMTH